MTRKIDTFDIKKDICKRNIKIKLKKNNIKKNFRKIYSKKINF